MSNVSQQLIPLASEPCLLLDDVSLNRLSVVHIVPKSFMHSENRKIRKGRHDFSRIRTQGDPRSDVGAANHGAYNPRGSASTVLNVPFGGHHLCAGDSLPALDGYCTRCVPVTVEKQPVATDARFRNARVLVDDGTGSWGEG